MLSRNLLQPPIWSGSTLPVFRKRCTQRMAVLTPTPVADTSFDETVVTAIARYALVCNRHTYERPFGPHEPLVVWRSAFTVLPEWTTS